MSGRRPAAAPLSRQPLRRAGAAPRRRRRRCPNSGRRAMATAPSSIRERRRASSSAAARSPRSARRRRASASAARSSCRRRSRRAQAERVAGLLGAAARAVFAGARMHTPVEVTDAGDGGRRARGHRRHRRHRRRLDHRSRQGDRAPHRPAADRHPDHLCRLGDDQPPRRDRRRREEDAARSEDPAGDGDLRRRPDAQPAAEPLGHLRAQRHGARGRGPLRAGRQSGPVADGGGRHPRARRGAAG